MQKPLLWEGGWPHLSEQGALVIKLLCSSPSPTGRHRDLKPSLVMSLSTPDVFLQVSAVCLALCRGQIKTIAPAGQEISLI